MPECHYTTRNPRHHGDLAGKAFGLLKVIEIAGVNADNRVVWRCECSCGETKIIAGKSLVSGRTRSCGCLHRKVCAERRTTHGGSKSSLYNIYNNMVARCCNPNADNYSYYGGRGITICEAWLAGFAGFQDWALSSGYEPGLSIERKDVNGNYEPGNCKWIPVADQQHNTRRSKMLTACGETKSLSSWVKDPRCKASYSAIKSRLVDGWDEEKAILTPRIRPPRGIRKKKQGPQAGC